MKKIDMIILLAPLLLLAGCSNEGEQTSTKGSSDDHFLSDQVRAMEKAQAVEQMLQSSSAQRQQEIEQQSR